MDERIEALWRDLDNEVMAAVEVWDKRAGIETMEFTQILFSYFSTKTAQIIVMSSKDEAMALDNLVYINSEITKQIGAAFNGKTEESGTEGPDAS